MATVIHDDTEAEGLPEQPNPIDRAGKIIRREFGKQVLWAILALAIAAGVILGIVLMVSNQTGGKPAVRGDEVGVEAPVAQQQPAATAAAASPATCPLSFGTTTDPLALATTFEKLMEAIATNPDTPCMALYPNPSWDPSSRARIAKTFVGRVTGAQQAFQLDYNNPNLIRINYSCDGCTGSDTFQLQRSDPGSPWVVAYIG